MKGVLLFMNFIFSEKICLSVSEHVNLYNSLLYLDKIATNAKNPETRKNSKDAILAIERVLDKCEVEV